MLLTIVAAVACVSAAIVPAVAEVNRMLEDRDRPNKLLDVPTRRVRHES
ncbi:MAG: hypothetical protein HC927_05740 [Deltaproteobacteria bacterium]|nr:hypothetical protein [Deltaproteobacteria bacterium]